MTRRLTRSGPPPEPGIVHLGPGAFFRSFVGVYTDSALRAAGGDWGILAVSLRSAEARDAMAPQGGCYTAVTRGPDVDVPRVIGSVAQVLVAPEDPEAVLRAMAAPEVRIVSLTVTEKGYCHDPGTGRLNLSHPDIAHDLAHPETPRSAPGLILAALARRRAAGIAPFTVLSCDNLPGNGPLLAGVLRDLAAARDGALADWIAETVACPATMVDRITPATAAEDIDRLAAAEGYRDPAMVVCEPFSQWVIEDDFPLGRPAWDAGGAQIVTSVAAHETMKLRCLNGTHSALAYLGYLAGHETIADAVADPPFAAFIEHLWRAEIVPTVLQPEGEDLTRYCAALIGRYRNPAIRHRTWQIAMDGSQKLPQRLLGSIRETLAEGRVPRGLCLVVAAWMRYVGGIDAAGGAIDVRDPMAGRLRALSDGADTPARKVAALLSVEDIFGADLGGNAPFRAEVTAGYEALADLGARGAVSAMTTR